jgi:hypothetical protein
MEQTQMLLYKGYANSFGSLKNMLILHRTRGRSCIFSTTPRQPVHII